MKTATTILGAVLLLLIGTGTMFKLMHWPGANVALILGIGLIFFFLIMVFASGLKIEASPMLRIAQGIGVFGGTMLSSAVMFKVMHWPGANVMLLFGMLILFFFFLPSYLIGLRQNKTEVKLTTHTVMVLAIFGMLFLALSGRGPTYNILHEHLKISHEIQASLAPADGSREKIYSSFEEKMKADPDGFRNYYDKSRALKRRSDDIRLYLKNMKFELISASEGYPADDSTDLFLLNSLDNNQIPTYYFIGDGMGGEGTRGYDLQKKLANYRADILSLINNKAEVGLNTSDPFYTAQEMVVPWAEYHFQHITLAGAIATLSAFENSVEAAEAAVLTQLLIESNTPHAENKSK